MLYQPRPNRPNDFIYCPKPQCRGQQKGALLPIVEEKILTVLEKYLDEFEITGQQKQHIDKSDMFLKQQAIDKKSKELDELTKQKNNLHDLLERGVYDIDTFMSRQQNISERMKKLEEEMLILKDEIAKEEMKEKNLNEYVPKAKKVLEAYRHTSDIEKKNKLLKSILEKATYLRKKEWKEKDHFIIQLYPKI